MIAVSQYLIKASSVRIIKYTKQTSTSLLMFCHPEQKIAKFKAVKSALSKHLYSFTVAKQKIPPPPLPSIYNEQFKKNIEY